MRTYGFKDVQGALPIVRLLVREKSGLWYVDQGYMLRPEADARKQGWNNAGFGCLILKHTWIPRGIRLCPPNPLPVVQVPVKLGPEKQILTQILRSYGG